MFAVYAKLVLSMIIWGGTWVAGRVVARDMDPFSAAFVRFFVASLFLIFFSMRLERRFPLPRRSELPVILLLGLTGVFGYNSFFFQGLKSVEAGRASLIIAAIPAVIALASRILFKEKLTYVRALGIPISLMGVWVIITKGDPSAILDQGVSSGDLFIFGCVACWTAYSLLGKRAMGTLSPVKAVTWSCIVGDVILLPAALAEGLIPQISHASPTIWLCLLFLGVLATGLSFSWYYEGIKTLGASKAGIFINLVPVAAVALGVVILGEKVTMSLLLGGALVLGGVWLTSGPGRKSVAKPSA